MKNNSKMWKTYAFFALSVVCLGNAAESRNRQARATHSKCYSFLGCFTLDSTMLLPQEPNTINSTTMLFNRVSSSNPVATIGAQTFLTDIRPFGTHVDTRKETKVIVHGYMHSAKTAWVPKMKDELLKKGDFNVLVVDWSHGNGPDYDQAASNTYMVGAELAYLINYLKQHYALNTSNVHIIGHSLGAQVSGHAGHRVNKVGRITGLDPAEPHFTFSDPDTRLDSSDADFVDIIHTDGSDFKGFAGYGLKTALGHVDFYANGGEHQPGCEEPTPSSINALLHGGLANIINSPLWCNHFRAYEYFTESINSPCKFYGHFCSSFSDFDSGHCNDCHGGLCPNMGYDVKRSSQRGSYYLSTSSTSPFCGDQYFVQIHMSFTMNDTFGKFLLTLGGSNMSSEEISFNREMKTFSAKSVEQHVITSSRALTQVSNVKVKFVKGQKSGADNSVHISSVEIMKLDPNGYKVLCGQNTEIQDQQRVTFSCNPSMYSSK